MTARRTFARAVSVAVFGITLGASLGACVDAPVAPVPPAPGTLLDGVAYTVIVPAFDSVAVHAAQLAAALDTLAVDPSPARVAAAQAVWVTARQSWELTEAFGFGPASTGGFDGRLDTWPLDLAGLGAFLAGTTPVTPDNVALLDPTLSGFHGIEAVLFGALDTPLDGSGSAAQVAAARAPAAVAAGLTQRRLAYVALAGHGLASTAAGLRDAWTPALGNYAGQLAGAGKGSSVYGTIGAGISEVVAGIADPADEVATSKIASPLAAQGADAVRYQESRFSDNTLADLTDDIASARALYLGIDAHAALALAPAALPAGTPTGVRALVLATNPAVDAQVRSDFAAALTALAAIGPSFGTTLVNDRAAVVAAQSAILHLRDTLLTRVAPLVGTVADND